MYQNGQNLVKTSELEDQYAIIFGLALWPQEPHEIIFFNIWQKLSGMGLGVKTSELEDQTFVKIVKMQ